MDQTEQNVVAVVGSPRPKGNTSFLVDRALAELGRAGVQTRKVLLARQKIGFCHGHDDCEQREECPLNDDAAALIDAVFHADGILLASPVYADNVSAQMKVFMDRCCHPFNRGVRLQARVAGLLTVADSTGLDSTIEAMKRFLTHHQSDELRVFSVTGFATYLGDAERNAELVEEAALLGRTMADALRTRD